MDYTFSWPLLSAPTPGFIPAPRQWKGQMCGIRLPNLPLVTPGGAEDPSLVMSWVYDRYKPTDRARIRMAWKSREYTHVALSWPDCQAVGGTPEFFRDICLELIEDGFYPCVFWCSKDFNPPDVVEILASIDEPLRMLTGIIPLACIGWELSLWLSPTQVQELIDAIAPRLTPTGCLVYVHFQEGYGSFQQPGHIFADFWNLNVGKLTGLLHQKILSQNPHEYRFASGGLVDILERFAGNAFCSPDSGFGHPFDLIAYEISAYDQWMGHLTEREGDALGNWAITTPYQTGPAGSVKVMGSGNGFISTI